MLRDRFVREGGKGVSGVFDPARWLYIGRREETGLGRLADDFGALFPGMRHAVLPSIRFTQNPLPSGSVQIPADPSDATIAALLEGLDGVVLFENPEPANIIRVAAALSVATVFVPMWEWFNPFFPDWHSVTAFACPNAICERVLRKLGRGPLRRVPWPLDATGLPARDIRGPARVFAHNSGIVERDDRKALRETLEAFALVKDPALRLIVRAQACDLPAPDDLRVDWRIGHLPSKSDLYAEGDVLVQPSKAEGLGFAILEAMACGLPVITADYPPMNEYIRDRRMLAAVRWGADKPVQASYIPHAHLKRVRVRSLARRIARCASRNMAPIAAANAAWFRETFATARVRAAWENVLAEAAARARIRNR